MGDIDRRSRWFRAGFALVVVMLAVAACAGAGTSLDERGAPVPQASAAPTAAPADGGQSGQYGNDGEAQPPSILKDSLKIVYTGSLQLVVADLPAALERGRAAVAAVGGYVGASQEQNDGDRSVATITYRIPASRWDEAIGVLRGFATKVVAEETQATEVGSQLVDLEARIRNLRASEAALQEIAKGAAKVTDLLEVERQLSDVRGQIEQLDAQRTQLADQVAYGTLVTTYGLEVVAVTKAAEEWDPAHEVDRATATLIGVGQGIATAAIWFLIVWVPFLLALVVLLLVARFVFRRFLAGTPRPHDPIAGWGEGG